MSRGRGVSLIFFGLILILSIGVVSALSGGGTSGTPFLITTCADLQQVKNDLDAYYKVLNDIDCTGYSSSAFLPIGSDITPFVGTFDGNAQTIKNLRIIRIGDNVGLFGEIGIGGTVKNLGLLNIYYAIQNQNSYYGLYSNVGGIAGTNRGTIEKCYVKGDGVKDNIESQETTFFSSYFGGIAGQNFGTIRNCYTRDLIIKGNYFIGGIAGRNYNPGVITNSYSASTIKFFSQGGYCGGIAGKNAGTGAISNSFATGKVGCSDNLMCLQSSNGDLYMGGLTGITETGGSITNNFWYDYPTSGIISGYSGTREDVAVMCIRSGSGTCIGQSLNYFQGGVRNKQPFTLWDFANTWLEVSGDYPILKWETSSDATDACLNAGGQCKWFPGFCSSSEQDLGELSCTPILQTCCKPTTTPLINGICGSVNGATLSVVPTQDQLCKDGTPSPVPVTSSSTQWSWNCLGLNGGTNSLLCIVTKGPLPTSVAACGAGGTYSSASAVITAGACASGNIVAGGNVPTSIILSPGDNLYWLWSCIGTDKTLSCSANNGIPSTTAVCGSPTFSYIMGSGTTLITIQNNVEKEKMCSSGNILRSTLLLTSSGGTSTWRWTCLGSNSAVTTDDKSCSVSTTTYTCPATCKTSCLPGENQLTGTGNTCPSIIPLCCGTAGTCNNNNVKETGESCDGTDLNGKSCTDFSFLGGTLSCKSDCTFNTINCQNVILDCGNEVLDSGEDCDYDGGLNCDDDCTCLPNYNPTDPKTINCISGLTTCNVRTLQDGNCNTEDYITLTWEVVDPDDCTQAEIEKYDSLSRKTTCSAKLPFFTWLNILLIIGALIIFYVLFELKRKTKSKKGKKRR